MDKQQGQNRCDRVVDNDKTTAVCSPRAGTTRHERLRLHRTHVPKAVWQAKTPDWQTQLSARFRSLEVVPLKLSVCECCSSANVSLSTNAMGKSKDKQAKDVKAAKPSTKSTKPALDPALSSLFASSVRAELFRLYAR